MKKLGQTKDFIYVIFNNSSMIIKIKEVYKMKKIIFFSLIILLVTGPPVFADCTDSDGGKNIYEKGSTNFYGIINTDECSTYVGARIPIFGFGFWL